ncbi:hypothetical protein GKE82_09500 [Conexibacter sp. W3-3-2]|uniref:hypothetical protein n=1 Tax=Conexibacter sp. W3-3-2 TaxID=2675227 RepID=UPI0012B77102|nr:hypothetical protein [Conexibacter sp. W3-3-2]MTD44519.1 hypothetical protein [Conexibacter sp. W3-3-2]
MRSPCATDLPVDGPADEAFEAALGVVQNTKNLELLAVHREGRRLIAYEQPKLTNARIHMVVVHDGEPTVVTHAVGNDPRTSAALLDGRFNRKAAQQFLEAVVAALDGSRPAPVTPVENHYMQKDERVPWTDPEQEPDIELGFSWRTPFG